MGQHMARNLKAAGHDLTVWTRSQSKAATFANDIGARTAAFPDELSQSCDVVITMLADDQAGRDVYLGDHGLIAGIAAARAQGPVLIEMGTMSPDHITQIAAHMPKNARFIDAPVSGATQAAHDATLMIMAGCTKEQAGPCDALFGVLGKETKYLGHLGAGCIMKLAVNSMIHGINQTLSEAMTLAEAAGIASDLAFDVIEGSAACAPMVSYRRPLYLNEDQHDVTFTVELARKDMNVTLDLAQKLGVPLPQGQVTLDKLNQAMDQGYAQRDMAAMIDFMRKEQR